MKSINKIGIIGTGGIAGAHIKSLRQVNPHLKFQVSSQDPKRGQAAAARLGTEPFDGNYDDMIGDDSFDAFIIITPHDQHAEYLEKCLATGKPTVIEKPVVCRISELTPILEGIHSGKYQAPFVAENWAFLPRLKESKHIQKINHIVANHYYAVEAKGWRLEKEHMGGGCLIDGGIHNIRALRMLAGDVQSVCAMTSENNSNLEGEGSIQLLMQFKSRITATLNYSWAQHGQPDTPEFLILGASESLALHLRKKTSSYYEDNQEKVIKHLGRFANVDLHYELGHHNCGAEFYSWMNEESRSAKWFVEGVKDLLVVEAAYRSLQNVSLENVELLPEWLEEMGTK